MCPARTLLCPRPQSAPAGGLIRRLGQLRWVVESAVVVSWAVETVYNGAVPRCSASQWSLSRYLSICLSICLFTYLAIYLSIYRHHVRHDPQSAIHPTRRLRPPRLQPNPGRHVLRRQALAPVVSRRSRGAPDHQGGIRPRDQHVGHGEQLLERALRGDSCGRDEGVQYSTREGGHHDQVLSLLRG